MTRYKYTTQTHKYLIFDPGFLLFEFEKELFELITSDYYRIQCVLFIKAFNCIFKPLFLVPQ